MGEPELRATILALRDAIERAAHFSFLDAANNPDEHVQIRRRDWEDIGRRMDRAAALSGDSRANGEPGPGELDAAWAEAEAAATDGDWFDLSLDLSVASRGIYYGAHVRGRRNIRWYGNGPTPAAALLALASRLRALREADPS